MVKKRPKGIKKETTNIYQPHSISLYFPSENKQKKVGTDIWVDQSKLLPSQKMTITVFTFFFYGLGTLVCPAVKFCTASKMAREDVLTDSEWHRRVLVVMLCGILAGLGGIATTHSVATAAQGTSAVIAVIQAGTMSVVGAVLIMVFCHEHLTWGHSISMLMVSVGIVISEWARPRKAKCGARGMALSPEQPRADRSHGNVHAPLEAALGGFLWGFGTFGKRYGVAGNVGDSLEVYSVCTYFVFICGTLLPVTMLTAYMAATGSFRSVVSFTGRTAFAMSCGIVSGIGGAVGTYAFAIADDNQGSVVAAIENGMYSVAAGILIMGVYSERPSPAQLASISLIVLAVVVGQAA